MNPEVVKAQIAGLLHQHPELKDDLEALELSLESETSAIEVCETLTRSANETKVQTEALAVYIKELKERQDRLALRNEKLREVIIKIMETASVKSLRLNVATVSVSYASHVTIVEREQVPLEYRRVRPWEPIKELIKKDIQDGKFVPGCALSNPEPHLTIRVK